MRYLIPALATLGTVALSSLTFSPGPVAAQITSGSYVGVGGALGVQEDDRGEGSEFAGVLAGRYNIPVLPFSLRAQALIGDSTAIVPTISYDFPLGWQTNVYLGAGVAFSNGDSPSPVGDRTSFALQPGIDFSIPNSNTVIFGNAIIAFDAYRHGGGTAVSVQGGVGFKF